MQFNLKLIVKTFYFRYDFFSDCMRVFCRPFNRVIAMNKGEQVNQDEEGSSETNERVDTAFSALRRAILDRALEPGARLPADSIGVGFGMSRTLAREALLRLERIGLVEMRPKRGAIVACPSISEAYDIFDARQVLENRCIEHVIRRWNSEIEAQLEDHVKKEETTARFGDVGASTHLAEDFHIKLGHLSGNQVLAKFIEETVSRSSLILALYGGPHQTDCSVSEHRMILNALKSGDQSAAQNLMNGHISALQSRAVVDEPPAEKLRLEQIIGRYVTSSTG